MDNCQGGMSRVRTNPSGLLSFTLLLGYNNAIRAALLPIVDGIIPTSLKTSLRSLQKFVTLPQLGYYPLCFGLSEKTTCNFLIRHPDLSGEYLSFINSTYPFHFTSLIEIVSLITRYTLWDNLDLPISKAAYIGIRSLIKNNLTGKY